MTVEHDPTTQQPDTPDYEGAQTPPGEAVDPWYRRRPVLAVGGGVAAAATIAAIYLTTSGEDEPAATTSEDGVATEVVDDPAAAGEAGPADEPAADEGLLSGLDRQMIEQATPEDRAMYYGWFVEAYGLQPPAIEAGEDSNLLGEQVAANFAFNLNEALPAIQEQSAQDPAAANDAEHFVATLFNLENAATSSELQELYERIQQQVADGTSFPGIDFLPAGGEIPNTDPSGVVVFGEDSAGYIESWQVLYFEHVVASDSTDGSSQWQLRGLEWPDSQSGDTEAEGDTENPNTGLSPEAKALAKEDPETSLARSNAEKSAILQQLEAELDLTVPHTLSGTDPASLDIQHVLENYNARLYNFAEIAKEHDENLALNYFNSFISPDDSVEEGNLRTFVAVGAAVVETYKDFDDFAMRNQRAMSLDAAPEWQPDGTISFHTIGADNSAWRMTFELTEGGTDAILVEIRAE